ncbi:hypothetical protein GDO86_012751, partial [Hymenochirus boettgeri]
YQVFAGSSERDVNLCKLFWNSVTLQPPLESRLVSGEIQQRLKGAGEPRLSKTVVPQQPMENFKNKCFNFDIQREQYLQEKSLYLNKVSLKNYSSFLLPANHEDKEAISRENKLKTTEKRSMSLSNDTDLLEEIRAVQQLE